MARHTYLRVSFDIALLLSVLFAPFWISAILAVFGMFYFKFFIESIILMLLSDLVYGTKEVRFGNIVPISFVLSLLVFIIVEFSKKKLKFYSK